MDNLLTAQSLWTIYGVGVVAYFAATTGFTRMKARKYPVVRSNGYHCRSYRAHPGRGPWWLDMNTFIMDQASDTKPMTGTKAAIFSLIWPVVVAFGSLYTAVKTAALGLANLAMKYGRGINEYMNPENDDAGP